MLHFLNSYQMGKYKISIPKPCHENWNAMQTEEKGRFCKSCSKTVIDFTKLSNSEINTYFDKNINTKICGRFKTEQLENIKIEIPEYILYHQTSYKKVFILALFLTMGTTLFSCKDQNNNIRKFDEIIVLEESISDSKETKLQTELKKDTVINKNIKKIPPPSNHYPQTMGIIVVDTENLKGEVVLKTIDIDSSKIYNLAEVEKVPIFQNEENEFSEYIVKNLILPNNIENLNSLVEFTISEEGKLENIKIIRGKNEELNNNIKTLFLNSPLWIPGEINGNKVNVKMTYPIRIKAK